MAGEQDPAVPAGLPKVSVVVFVRNEARYIGQTIESILAQDYRPLELHVQDGASTDNTVEVIKSYPVSYASEPDSGQSDAARRGFAATDGEIVIFEGGDDLLLPGAVSLLAEALRRNPDAGFAYGDAQYIDGRGDLIRDYKSRAFDLDDLFWQDFIPSQSVAVRRSAVSATGLYRHEVFCADWDLWLRLGARYPSVYVPQMIAQYRIHSGSATLKNLRRFAESTKKVADDLLDDDVVRRSLKHGPERARAGSYLLAASSFLLAGDAEEGRKLLRSALSLYPKALFTRRGVRTLAAFLLGVRLYGWIRRRKLGAG